MASLVGPACIIQSDFRSGEQGNFEAVLFAEGQLHHVLGSGADWQRGQTLPGPASGPGSIIQSDFRKRDHSNFEVVLWAGTELWHYFHDNSDVNLPWQRAQRISAHATGPGCIIQSDFKAGDHGNFEVVVLEGNQLVHYFHDNSDVNLPWQRAQTISTRATGPGCIIQSDFKEDDRVLSARLRSHEICLGARSASVEHRCRPFRRARQRASSLRPRAPDVSDISDLCNCG